MIDSKGRDHLAPLCFKEKTDPASVESNRIVGPMTLRISIELVSISHDKRKKKLLDIIVVRATMRPVLISVNGAAEAQRNNQTH